MSYSADGNRFRLIWLGAIFGAFAALGLLFNQPSLLHATDSTINARVCGTAFSMNVNQPMSDTVVSAPTVNFTGQVNQIGQIDIRVDGDYSHTVAVGFGQTQFTTSVTLVSGTHTVTLVGRDACSTQTTSQSVVLTYQPQDQPSNPGGGGSPGTPPSTPPTAPRPPSYGSDVPTQIGDQPGGVIVSRPIDGEPKEFKDGSMPGFLQTILRISDFESIGRGNTLLNILRLIGLMMGMFLIIGASGVVGLIARWRENEFKRWHLRAVQIGGLLLILGAILI